MDKNTLSQYGWVVIAIIVLIILIALATPFGSYISKSVSSSVKAFDNKVDSMFDQANLKYIKPEFNAETNGTEPDNTEPALVLTSAGASYGTVIRNDITPKDFFTNKKYDGIVFGFNIDYINGYPYLTEEQILTYVKAENGSINVVPSQIQNDYGTGAIIQLIDNNNVVVKEYGVILFGDVDGDGFISSNDSSHITQYDQWSPQYQSYENSLQYYASDVNGDGAVDGLDAGDCEMEEATQEQFPPESVLVAALVAQFS